MRHSKGREREREIDREKDNEHRGERKSWEKKRGREGKRKAVMTDENPFSHILRSESLLSRDASTITKSYENHQSFYV